MVDYRAPLDELPDPLPIVPLERPFDVTITPPGSKSITNRAYVLAALADGESKIIRPLRSEDTDALLEALCTLGAEARWVPGDDGEDVFIKGVNGRFPRGGSVNLGDGGTPTRFIIAAACLAAEPVTVDGSPRMRERPIAEGVEMLRHIGAQIEYVEEEGRLPVRVVPSEVFKGGELTVGKTASSQFISAVMLIAPWLEQGVCIRYSGGVTSPAYIWLTFQVMDDWHICTECDFDDGDDEGWIQTRSDSIPTTSGRVEGQTYQIDSDASSAAYWLTAASLCEHSRVRIKGLSADAPQPDVRLAGVLESMGARVFWSDGDRDLEFGWRGALRGSVQDALDMPDAAMSLSIACACADGPSTITGLHTLRVKETDRIAALANELRKVGCTVETTHDSITIDPSTRHDEPVTIETYNDHRMAMSFAILGLVRPDLSIANPACVAKSYPTFWRDFARLYEPSP